MQDDIKLNGGTVPLAYKLGPRMVVFSHGFGVKRDDRGLFTDIAAALPPGIGYVMFDYYNVDEAQSTVRAISFRDQVQRLQSVLDWTIKQHGVAQIDIVGHSMGCLVVAELSPENVATITFLAPPTNGAGGRRRQRYTNVAGAEQHDGYWYIPRRDGTTTIVPESYFDELEQVDAEGELVKLALFRPYTLVIAGADEVLEDPDYTELMVLDAVTTEGIETADHNFTSEARPKLIEIILAQLG